MTAFSHTEKKRRLVILPDTQHHERADFEEIARRIRQQDGEIDVVIASKKNAFWKLLLKKKLPTLYVSMRNLKSWKPSAGLLLHGENLLKSEQLDRLNQHGFQQPPHLMVEPSTQLDPDVWGPYVVVKPEMGRRGEKVKIMKTSKVRFEKFGPDRPHFVQQFVYTGPEPTSYRVLTLMGRTLYLMKSVNVNCGEKLEEPKSTKQFAGHNIVATAREGEVTLVDDPEVREYAEAVAQKVFPHIPLLGIDVLRNSLTGELSVSEVNPWGSTWHFSSELGKQIQESIGQRFEEQFGAFDIAACVLAEKTHVLAR